MQYKQYIFGPIPTGGDPTEIRINYRARQPLLGTIQGLWNSLRTYATTDVVANSSGKFWRALQSNTNQTPVEGIYWTAADNLDFIQSDQTKVLILDPTINPFPKESISAIQAYVSREQGKITPFSRETPFYDYFSYTGTTGAGVAASEDLTTTAYKSLANKIFDDYGSTYQAHFARIKPATLGAYASGTTYHAGDIVTSGGDTWEPGKNAPSSLTGVAPGSTNGGEDESAWIKARELYFVGHIDGKTLTGKDLAVANERTANALQKQDFRLTIESIQNLATTFVLQDLFPLITTADFATANAIPFVLGLIINQGQTIPNGVLDGDDMGYATGYVGHPPRVHQNVISVNMGFHLITFSKIIAKIAERMNCSFDEANDFSTGYAAWTDTHNLGAIQSARITPSAGQNLAQTLGVCYEYCFGSDPRCDLNVSQMTSDISFDWNATLASILERVAREFHGYIRTEYDQLNKRPRLRVLNQRQLNTVAGSTLSASLTSSATSMTVASLSAFKGSRTYPFPVQLSSGGAVEAVMATGDNGVSAVTIERIQTGLAWSSGAAVNPVRLLPSKWELTPDSARDRAIVSARHVEVGYVGDTDTVACPTLKGDALKIDIGWRAKKLGRLNTKYADTFDAIYNASLTQDNQESTRNVFTGGTNYPGRHIVGTDATIAFIRHDSTTGIDYYSINSPTHDFSYLATSNGDVSNAVFGKNDAYGTNTVYANTGKGDVFCFANGAFAVMESIVDTHTVHVTVQKGAAPPVQIDPPTGSSIPFCVGYNFFVNNLVTQAGGNNLWISSATLDFKNNDVFGNAFVGQEIVIPSQGIFTISSYDPGGTSNTHQAGIDRPILLPSTGLVARVGGPQINSDGWVIGSFMYFYNTFQERFRAATPSTLNSAMTVSRFQWNGFSAPPSDDYGNALASPAQVNASQSINVQVQLGRKYAGYTADDGTVTGYAPQDAFVEYNAGALRFFVANGMEICEWPNAGWVRVTATEWPDFSALLDFKTFPVWVVGSNGSSGGAAGISGIGVGGSASGGVTVSNDVITNPSTPHRNKIQSGVSGTSPLEIERLTGATDDLLDFWKEDGTTKLAKFDSNGALTLDPENVVGLTVNADPSQTVNLIEIYDTAGALHTWFDNNGDLHTGLVDTTIINAGSGTFNGAVNMQSHQINNVTDPTAAQDAATKHYVDTQANQDVALAPSTPTRNQIQPTASGVPGIILKSFDNATDYMQLLDDTGATVATWHGSTGQLVLPYIRLLGAGTTMNAVATIDNLGQVDGLAQTNGQLLIGSTGNLPTPATLTAGTGITITNGAGTITIASSAGGSGTVTSVNVSGGTTGLTTSGGPITTSGTITLAGTLSVAHGGTNATTANAALNNLLPTQTGNSGKVLTTNGTNASWGSAGGTVTSVNVSGGTTGLTTSGGPVTTSGTITLAGTLAVANGGTGQTSFTDGQLLIGNTSTTGLTKATLASADGTVTITNGHGSIDLSTANGSYRTKIRTVKFYSGGSVIKTFTFNVQETWDSTNSVWIPQWGYALPFEAKTGSTYGWNALFLFHKTGTEHGNVEIVGISATGVPDYWANAVTQIKRDTSATANQNVYYGVTFPMWSEDNGTWLEQKPLEKGNPARRIYVAGRIFITGSTATPPILLSWVNISDPIFPISDQEILKDTDKDGATPTAPTLTWQPVTPSLLIDFGPRLKPVGLQCTAVLATAAGGASYSIAAMPCRNQVGTANQATIEFSKTTVAAGALVYTPRTDPTAPPGQSETIYVEVWGLLEIIGDDARTA